MSIPFFISFPSYYTTIIISDLTYIRADKEDKTDQQSQISVIDDVIVGISSSLTARF